jgi:hypothetical protein
MCCNGTLFNYVTLVPDDMPKLEKYPQLVFQVRNELATFNEPCVLHTGSGCSAYADRPATCERYVCNVLRKVERDEMTEDEALLVIKEGKALVENVKEYVAFEPGMPMSVSSWDDAPEGIAEEARLAWERTAYHLGKYFLGSVQEEVDPDGGPVAPASGSPAFAELPVAERERHRAARAALFTAAKARAARAP